MNNQPDRRECPTGGGSVGQRIAAARCRASPRPSGSLPPKCRCLLEWRPFRFLDSEGLVIFVACRRFAFEVQIFELQLAKEIDWSNLLPDWESRRNLACHPEEHDGLGRWVSSVCICLGYPYSAIDDISERFLRSICNSCHLVSWLIQSVVEWNLQLKVH